jgi:pimeloyl-ACP methyl ester carboxylesterase
MAFSESVTRTVGLLLILFFAATIFAYAFQGMFIYYPEVADFGALEPRAAREGLLPWRDAEGNVIGWHKPQGTGRPLFIVHGNAGNALHRTYIISRLQDAGINPPVFILEYPGYGVRPGTPSEKSLVLAAVSAIDHIAREVIVFGESLGTGVACAAAAQRPHLVRGALLITPFDSLTSVAKKHYPWLPVSLILKDRYDSSRALQNVRIPIAILTAERDHIIPVDSAIRLYEAYSGPKKLWRVAGAGHNEVLQDIPNSELRAAYEFANSH